MEKLNFLSILWHHCGALISGDLVRHHFSSRGDISEAQCTYSDQSRTTEEAFPASVLECEAKVKIWSH